MPRRAERSPSQTPPFKRPQTGPRSNATTQGTAVQPPRQRTWFGLALLLAVAVMLLTLAWVSYQRRQPNPNDPIHLKENAQALLREGRAFEAEQILKRLGTLIPNDPQPWLLRLEMLRVEDRPLEAQSVGWQAYDSVPESSRRDVLKTLTLALLADTPDDLARATLKRWSDANPEDVEAQVALLRRIAATPRPGDLNRPTRIARLTALLSRYPEHLGVREALIIEFADAGQADQGRALLDSWPADHRDARYDRLRGRWNLEYDQQFERAVESLKRGLVELPHDWKTHYRLARALRRLGHDEDAARVAETVGRLREVLDPLALGKRLDDDLARLSDPKARLDLADLCARVGLTRLAQAWRLDAEANVSAWPGLTPVPVPPPRP